MDHIRVDRRGGGETVHAGRRSGGVIVTILGIEGALVGGLMLFANRKISGLSRVGG